MNNIDLAAFINYNSHCPICGEKLTLYAQVMNSACFVGKQVSPQHIKFVPHLLTEKLGAGTHSLDLVNGHWKINSECLAFTSNAKARVDYLYLFFLCNPAGFKLNSNNHDYEINLYKGCYNRSTPLLKFERTRKNKHKKRLVYSDQTTSLHCREDFSFKKFHDATEKVYMLSLQEQHKQTVLWYYSVTDEQKKSPGFKPSVFEKAMPPLNKRPDFSIENRDKLLERFDSWILMS